MTWLATCVVVYWKDYVMGIGQASRCRSDRYLARDTAIPASLSRGTGFRIEYLLSCSGPLVSPDRLVQSQY